jgi:esterase/lipase
LEPIPYQDALKQIQLAQARDTAAINPLGGSQLLTHGRKVERALVLLHGYTNNPQMFGTLGKVFFDRGYNVWIPRMSHHGYRDRLTSEHGKLTRAELIAWATESLNIACGLGERVTIAGCSMGGVMSAWAAQYCSELDKAVLIVPSFATARVSERWNTLMSRALLWLPNLFVWWDPAKQTNTLPAYAYPRFSTHALAQIYLLGADIYARARQSKPAAPAILSVTSAKDAAVNNRVTTEVVENWRAHGANIETYEFSGDDVPFLHDIISPEQVGARTDVIYPVLVDLIAK